MLTQCKIVSQKFHNNKAVSDLGTVGPGVKKMKLTKFDVFIPYFVFFRYFVGPFLSV